MKKRLLAGLLVLCMVLALGLTACSGGTNATTTTTAAADDDATTTTTAAEGDGETTTAAEGGDDATTAAEGAAPATWENLSWEKDTSPVTFSAFIDYDWYAVDTWGGEVCDEITRLTGVSLDVTKSADRQVLSVQLAAQELSDIVFTDNLPQRFEDPDVCYRWDELAAEHCPEFFDLVDPLEVINNTAADGHVYTFKTHYKDEADYADENAIGNFTNATIVYRADIANKLGIATPFTTVEGFEEALYTVKENAADYGVQIVFNMHPSWAEILSYWMGCPQNNAQWDEESKSIKLRFRDEKWLEYYKLLNKWYRDGLLAADYLGVRPEDFFSRNESNVSFAASYNWGYAKTLNQKLRDNNAGGKYDDLSQPVWALIEGGLTYKGVDGLQEVSYDYGTGWSSCFISSNCENPGRAICYMEFLKSPQGDQLTQWGIEGVHFDLVDGLPVTREDYKARPTEQKESSYTGIGPWYFQGSDRYEGIPNGPASVLNAIDEWAAYDAQCDVNDRTIKKAACYNDKNPAMSFARVESDDDEMAMYTKITDEWTKAVAAMVTAESEAACEQAWNDFQAYMVSNGLEAVEAKMTERYVENLKRYQDAGYFTDIVTE